MTQFSEESSGEKEVGGNRDGRKKRQIIPFIILFIVLWFGLNGLL